MSATAIGRIMKFLTVLITAGLLAACGTRTSDEEQVRALIDELESAAEARDASDVVEVGGAGRAPAARSACARSSTSWSPLRKRATPATCSSSSRRTTKTRRDSIAHS